MQKIRVCKRLARTVKIYARITFTEVKDKDEDDGEGEGEGEEEQHTAQ